MEEKRTNKKAETDSLLFILFNKVVPKYLVLTMISFALYAAFRESSEVPSGKITLVIAVLSLAAKAVFDDIITLKRRGEIDQTINKLKTKVNNYTDGTDDKKT